MHGGRIGSEREAIQAVKVGWLLFKRGNKNDRKKNFVKSWSIDHNRYG